jgi:hypothetical protein
MKTTEAWSYACHSESRPVASGQASEAMAGLTNIWARLTFDPNGNDALTTSCFVHDLVNHFQLITPIFD